MYVFMIFIKICVVVILFLNKNLFIIYKIQQYDDIKEKEWKLFYYIDIFKNKFVIINFKYIFFIIIVNKMIKIFLLKKVIYLIILYYFKNLEII